MVQDITQYVIMRDNKDNRPQMARGGGLTGGGLTGGGLTGGGYAPSRLQRLTNASKKKNVSNLDRLKNAGGGHRAKKKMKNKKK